MSEQTETIIVLDFGSQYSQLIARRIRECNVYSKILPYYTSADIIAAENPKGVILSGGPSSVQSAIRKYSTSMFPCWASATDSSL